MTTTRKWLAGAGISAVLLLGAAVPAMAQDAGEGTAPTEEQSTTAPSEGQHAPSAPAVTAGASAT